MGKQWITFLLGPKVNDSLLATFRYRHVWHLRNIGEKPKSRWHLAECTAQRIAQESAHLIAKSLRKQPDGTSKSL
jgi:hypothetical protein